MHSGLRRLLEVVEVEPAGRQHTDQFRAVGSQADGVDATFGGHFLGQAVAAANATVGRDRFLHSLHGYFLRAGRPGEHHNIAVDRVRDGRSFSTRRVSVSQDKGKPQFEMLASFAVPEDGPLHPAKPPADFAGLPAPEALPTYLELMHSLEALPLPEAWALRDYGLDIRTVAAPWCPGDFNPDGGIRLWIKAIDELPGDPRLHAAILAYQSDESLADNIATPFGITWGSPDGMFVSLDHVMWFHAPIDLNQWHFVDQAPVIVGGGRGLASGSVWNAAGELVVSFQQEALLRVS